MSGACFAYQWQRCACCNKVAQSGTGKLLHCLHVICADCLGELISDTACVTCSLCRKVTEPRWPGVDLSRQLPNCLSFGLFAKEVGKSTIVFGRKAAAASVRGGESSGNSQGWLSTAPSDVSSSAASAAAATVVGARRQSSSPGDDRSAIIAVNNDPDRASEPSAKRPRPPAQTSMDTTPSVAEVSSVISRHQGGERGYPPGESRVSGAGGHLCTLHRTQVVRRYCEHCRKCVCRRCIAQGHVGHNLSEIAEAAAAQRIELAQLVLATPPPAASVADGNDDRGVADLDDTVTLATKSRQVQEQIRRVRSSTEKASGYVEDVFARMEQALAKRKVVLLADIEQKSWKILRGLEQQHQQLNALLQSEFVGKAMTSELVLSESCDVELLYMAPIIAERFAELGACKGVPQSEHAASSLAAVQNTPLSMLESMMTVESLPFELALCQFGIPDEVIVNRQTVVTVAMFNGKGQPVPKQQCMGFPWQNSVTGASGEVACSILRFHSDLADNVVELEFTPTCIGQHRVELSVGCQVAGTDLTVLQAACVRLDAKKSSEHFLLSEEGRCATLSAGPCRSCNALAVIGYRTGRHEWTVRVHDLRESPVCVGVSAAPYSMNYDRESIFYRRPHACYFWYSTGEGMSSDISDKDDRGSGQTCTARARTSPWLNHDLLSFVLDCEKRQLQLFLHRTGETGTIDAIDCRHPLYPAVNFCDPGHRVEFTRNDSLHVN